MTQPTWLSLKDLRLTLESFSLQGLGLEIREGEYFVLLGPTGAGKTILLEAIAGILPIQSGTVELDGLDLTSTPPEKRGIGFVYQDYALFPHLSVERNISFGLFTKKGSSDRRKGTAAHGAGQSRRAVTEKVMQISKLLKIEDLLDRKPGTLSGGEKQRVAMARALIKEPKLLLLDEPLGSLDPETRETIQFELRRIHEELGTTTLHITHNFEVAAALADRIGVIMDGRIVQIGTVREVFRRPVNESVARFVGVGNIFRGEHFQDGDGGGYLQLDGFRLASISDFRGPARASIRPEDILLSRMSLVSSARNNFKGKVIQVSDRGPFSYVTIRIPAPEHGRRSLDLIALVTHSAALELELRVGQEIYAAFKASALHVF